MLSRAITAASAPAEQLGNLRTYKVAIYDTLAKLIAELELPPGTRLVEAELVTRFNVSKTPIREALLPLEADGLVTIAPYHGATVTWLSVQEYEDIVFILDALMQAALPLVAERMTQRDRDVLSSLAARLVARRNASDSAGFFSVAGQAHERLLSVTRSARLVRSVMSVMTHPLRRYERVFTHQFDDTWDLELDIMTGRIECLNAGDALAAAEHVRERRAAMIELIMSHVDEPQVARYLAENATPPPRQRRRGPRT